MLDDIINNPLYKIVYCNITDDTIYFYVTEYNDSQKEIPKIINGKDVEIIKVM